MVITPKYKGFMCLTAHPVGCYKNVEDMVNLAIKARENYTTELKNVVVIGASGGFGLAARVVSAFSYGAKTIGISLEKESTDKRTATAGHYNNKAFNDLAKKHGLPYITINGDAFSNEIKDEVISSCRDLFKGKKINLLIYSLAAPKRIHPDTNQIYSSVIKPVGKPYNSKTVDFHTGVVSSIYIPPATDDEIDSTIKVMGGED